MSTASGPDKRPKRTSEPSSGAVRSYFCRTCGLAQSASAVPAGWYTLERGAGRARRHLWLGLYCSVRCLLDAAAVLEEGETTKSRKLARTEPPAHARARQLERAPELLARGMSVRAIGDELAVPTDTVRLRLRQAGLDPLLAPLGPAPGDALARLNTPQQTGRVRQVEWAMHRSDPPGGAVRVGIRLSAQALVDSRWEQVSVDAHGSTCAAARTGAVASLLDALRSLS